MPETQATIVVVPRERFSYAQRSLTSIFDNTAFPFRLIYVDAGTPPIARKHLQEESEQRNFQLLSTSRYLSPNQARNWGWQAVHTKYTVFVDNDALVTPGWLEQLVRCAEETEAWVVGPLYLIGELRDRTVHLAGGTLHTREERGGKMLYDEQYLFNAPLDSLPAQLERKQWDYAEFHCMLVRTDLLQRLGPLDEGLFSLQEHIDLGLAVRKAGGSIYMEPRGRTSYVPVPPGEWWDLPYFMLRWSEPWNIASVRHFNRKWGYDGLGWLGNKNSAAGVEDEDTIVRFGRGHRRLMTGLRMKKDSSGFSPQDPLEEARLMVALFLSVDRDCFDLTLGSLAGDDIEVADGLDPQGVFGRIESFMQRAETDGLSVMIQPRDSRKSTDPALVRVTGLDADAMDKFRPFAFLILQIDSGLFEVWIAVDRANWRSAAIIRDLFGSGSPANRVPIAGCKTGPNSTDRVRLFEGVAGMLVSAHQLDRNEIRPYLSSSPIF
jgi:Glycosyl transferase family 2